MKPYLQRVVDRLKDQGLDVAEDALVKISDALHDEAVVELEGDSVKWNDYLIQLVLWSKGLFQKLIDKLDGKEG